MSIQCPSLQSSSADSLYKLVLPIAYTQKSVIKPATFAMSPSLPSGDSPDLHLVVSTPEEIIAQQQANSDEWRGVLSLPAYLRREEMLAEQDLTKDGGLTAWALVYQPPGSSEEDRRVVCGCETIRKRALVASNNAVEFVTAHGVCSVFCPPQNRGKGYAGRMMNELGERLKTWQSKGQSNLFSVLWSDIGKVRRCCNNSAIHQSIPIRTTPQHLPIPRSSPQQDFYAARGWRAFPSSHISLDANPEIPSHLPPTQSLKATDLHYLCESDESALISQIPKGQKPTVALVPDIATLSWHHAREEFTASELFSDKNHKPEIKGAIVGSEAGKQAWCIWTRVWTNPSEEDGNTLHILRLVVEDGLLGGLDSFSAADETGVANVQDSEAVAAVAALFAAARKEASEWEMEAVEFWNPNSVALAAARKLGAGAKVHEREKASISSLRWYGEGSGDEVEWACNEKYGWC